MRSGPFLDVSEHTRTRIERFLEAIVILAALATIPLTYYQAQGHSGPAFTAADWIIWIIFAVEYAVMIAIVRDRRAYTRRNWLMVPVIVLTFPVLPHLLNLARLVRLVRVIRLVRLFRLSVVTARGIRALRIVLGRHELVFIGTVSVVLVLAGGAGLALLEPELADAGIPDGLWWAIVTATTVGYGDIAPETTLGRILGVMLMLLGIGIVGTLAASIAAYFVDQDDSADMEKIKSQLAEIQETQQQLIQQQQRLEALINHQNGQSKRE